MGDGVVRLGEVDVDGEEWVSLRFGFVHFVENGSKRQRCARVGSESVLR